MNPQEEACLGLLVDAWNAFVALPVEHPCEREEFMRAVHAAQHILMARPELRRRAAKPEPRNPDEDPGGEVGLG